MPSAKGKRSAQYWQERADSRMANYLRDSDETLQIIGKAFGAATNSIQGDIDRIFGNYAKRHNLTLDEARGYLAEPASYLEYERLLAQLKSVDDPQLRQQLLARINAPSAAYRMSRLQVIQGSIAVQIGRATAVEVAFATSLFQRTVREAYGQSLFDIQRGTRYMFSVDVMSPARVQEILRNPWSGMNYSTRIWKRQEKLIAWLEKDLTAGMMAGKSSARLARELRDKLGVAYSDAERLVRTETNYMANAAAMQSYREAGIEKYRFLATLDSRTSALCQEHDGDVFLVSQAVPGKNMPPLHPHCRSTTTCYIDEETLAGMERRARGPVTGKNMLVPANMTYEDWIGAQKALHGEDAVKAAFAQGRRTKRKTA